MLDLEQYSPSTRSCFRAGIRLGRGSHARGGETRPGAQLRCRSGSRPTLCRAAAAGQLGLRGVALWAGGAFSACPRRLSRDETPETKLTIETERTTREPQRPRCARATDSCKAGSDMMRRTPSGFWEEWVSWGRARRDVALSRVLAEFQKLGVPDVLCVGDIADGMGDVNRVCTLLEDHRVLTVIGNHDRWLLSGEMREDKEATHVRALTPRSRKFVDGLPTTRVFDTPRGRLLLCHGVGDDDMSSVKRDHLRHDLERNDALKRVLANHRYDFMVNGHTHQTWCAGPPPDHLTREPSSPLRAARGLADFEKGWSRSSAWASAASHPWKKSRCRCRRVESDLSQPKPVTQPDARSTRAAIALLSTFPSRIK